MARGKKEKGRPRLGDAGTLVRSGLRWLVTSLAALELSLFAAAIVAAILGYGLFWTKAPRDIWEALENNDSPSVHIFLRAGVSPDTARPADPQATLLTEAARLGYEEAVAELIAGGADPASEANSAVTCAAVATRRARLLETLLRAGAPVSSPAGCHAFGAQSPADLAIELREENLLAHLIAAGLPSDDPGTIAAFCRAASIGRRDMVDMLTAAGVTLDPQRDCGSRSSSSKDASLMRKASR